MKQFSYDVVVAYRVYPKISTNGNPPPVFPDDKLKLTEFCLQSYKNSLGGLRVKMWAILNTCPPEYEALFRRIWPAEDLEIVKLTGAGPGNTVHKQLEILVAQTDAEIVHFAEDDYFYLPGQLLAAVDFIRQNPDADFIAPYESSDFYEIDLHRMDFETRQVGGRVWNSCLSATHTFMARRAALIECQDMIRRLVRIHKGKTIPDLAMWAALTKKRIFNPVKFIQWSLTRRWFWAGSMALAWYWCWRQILFGRKYKLWSPHPCLANHMVTGLAAPGVDWRNEFQKQLDGIQPETCKS